MGNTLSPEKEKPCILVVHASVGSGHRSAANSVAEALREFQGNLPDDIVDLSDDFDVEVLDILDFGSIRFDGDKAASLFTGVTRPIYDLTWRFTFTGRLLWGGGLGISFVMFQKFTKYVQKKKPLAIIATHIMAANCAAGARMITGQSYPIISVPTDYETEGLWPHKETDLFCVATEAMAETLRPRKVPEEKILITGIPTRKGYREKRSQKKAREQFNLPQDKHVVLALAGAHLPTPYIHFRNALDLILPAMNTLEDMHLVIIAGKDETYAHHLRKLVDVFNLKNVTVFDYVMDMASLMAAADVAICKSGGLTVTECLCSSTPMILIGQAYGQEKANVLMLTSQGAAKHVTTARELLNSLKIFSQRPQAMEALLVNGNLIRRPMAAVDIAHASLRLAQKEKRHPKKRRKKLMGLYWGKQPAHTR